jgi:hypothetical protein
MSFLDSLNFLEGLCKQRHRTNRLCDDTAYLSEQGILPVKLKILLPAAHLRPKEPFALQAPQFPRQVGRIDAQPPRQITQMQPCRGV